MTEGYDLEADLTIALQTHDRASFKQALQNSNLDMILLQDQNKCNIFHELGKSEIPEKLLFEFFEILISFFYKRYSEAALQHIKLLISSQTIDEKCTPLHFAVWTGKLVRDIQKLAKEYVRLGANKELKTARGQNLAHLAARKGAVHVLAYLKYELGVTIDEYDEDQMSCLHYAAKGSNEHIINMLISWGSELNAQDLLFNSPLHYAAANGHYKTVRSLLIAGANPCTKNHLNETPSLIASSHNNLEISELLVIPK